MILNIIRTRQPISRVKISKLARLNKSTVSSIVADLLKEDLIYEEVDQDSNVGRNPINLHLKLDEHFVGAINFDAHMTRMAIFDIDGSVKADSETLTNSQNGEDFVAACVKELFRLRDRCGITHLKGVGVSVAGIVDSTHAKVAYAPNLGWEDFEIGQLIRKYCKCEGTISVENDAKASALAELWFGKHDIDFGNFVFLSIGPGIGTGIVVEKKLVAGESHAAGEFGHMILFEGGELCSCGNNGCWEAYASDRATVRRYLARKNLSREEAPELLLQDIIERVHQSDIVAREVLTRAGFYLGMGISNIIKAVDPKAIVIGGRITQAWSIIYPEIMQEVTRRAFFGKKRSISILPTSLTIRPRVLGAATLAIKEIFSDLKITV